MYHRLQERQFLKENGKNYDEKNERKKKEEANAKGNIN